MTTDYMRDVWPRVVARRYDLGGHMVALGACDLVVDGVAVHIEVDQVLTRDQATVYGGDVLHILAGKPA